MNEFIQNFGYLAVFLLAGFDHSGTPMGIILSMGFVTTGGLDLAPTMVITTLGGVFGDLMLYSIGFFGGNRALQWFKSRNNNFRESIVSAEEHLHKSGPIFLIWGRFVAFVGRFLGLVYGSIRYSLFKFLILSTLGSTLITLGFGLPTYFLGTKANELFQNPNFTLYLSLGLVVLQIAATGLWMKVRKKTKNTLES